MELTNGVAEDQTHPSWSADDGPPTVVQLQNTHLGRHDRRFAATPATNRTSPALSTHHSRASTYNADGWRPHLPAGDSRIT